MPDEYDAVRSRLTNYEKGLYFDLGRAHERGETLENGWVRQFRLETPAGARILDAARTEGRGTRGIERKSGRVNEVDAREQLDKERAGLEAGVLAKSRWETVAGEKIPPKIAKDLQDMARDFGDKFQHVIISRADALRAVKLGQSLVSQQLELIRPYELNRADRARERLAKIRAIVRAQERGEKFRKVQQFREGAARGRADAPQQSERDRQVRAEARAAAEQERVAASKAQDQARNAAFKELDEKGRLSEVERLVWLGQATHPQAAVRQSPGQAPGVERGGTGQGHDRSRGVARDR
ncbi:hypothetical protein ACW9HR_30520 [Nocardia gipuzkoensis]